MRKKKITKPSLETRFASFCLHLHWGDAFAQWDPEGCFGPSQRRWVCGVARGPQLAPALPQPHQQPRSHRAEQWSPAAFTCHEQLLSLLIILKLSGLSDTDNLCELIILW